VPDDVIEAPGVPTTLNGKRMEVPVKRLLLGANPEDVASRDAVADPSLLQWYAEQHSTAVRRAT